MGGMGGGGWVGGGGWEGGGGCRIRVNDGTVIVQYRAEDWLKRTLLIRKIWWDPGPRKIALSQEEMSLA